MAGGGFGALPLGSGTMGAGTSVGIRSARQSRLNAVDVLFFGLPYIGIGTENKDVLNPRNWTLTVREPFGATERLVQTVTEIDDQNVRVWFDGELDDDAVYRVTVSDRVEDIYGVNIEPTARTADFDTFREFKRRAQREAQQIRSDLANPFMPTDAPNGRGPLGTYQVTSSGDYARESQRRYLRKRVFRRVTTPRGGFFHLPGYGAAPPPKGLIRTTDLRTMRNDLRSQILEEPDVLGAQVRVQQSASDPELVIVALRVVDRFGEFDMTVPTKPRSQPNA